jgi:hypothetical protein
VSLCGFGESKTTLRVSLISTRMGCAVGTLLPFEDGLLDLEDNVEPLELSDMRTPQAEILLLPLTSLVLHGGIFLTGDMGSKRS